jgi:hypothetical protein
MPREPIYSGRGPKSTIPCRRQATGICRRPSLPWEFDYSTIRGQAESLRQQGFAVCCGTAGDTDFINGIARARGMEQVLMDLIDDSILSIGGDREATDKINMAKLF